MSVEANKQLVRAFYEAIGNEDYDALHEFCHEDFVFYPQINTPFSGVEGLVESEKKILMLLTILKCQLKN